MKLHPCLAGAIATLVTMTGCSANAAELVVVGTVEDDVQTVPVPVVPVPAVNLDAGFVTQSSGDSSTLGSSSVATTYGLGSVVRITQVMVAEGDAVAPGQILARVDDDQLQAQLAATRADQSVAVAQVGLLGDAIDDTYDRAQDIAEAKQKVSDAIHKLQDNRAKLLKARTALKKARADLAKKLRSLQTLLAHYPPVVPPGADIPPREALPGLIAQLRAGIRKIDQNRRKLNTALPKLEKGLRQAKDGLSKLNDATAKLVDARGSLRGLKELAAIQAEALNVRVDLARVQLSLTEITAPTSGVLVAVAQVGDQLAPGAAVAEIREERPSRVTAWLAPSQLDRLCLGDRATITGDWMDGTDVPASLTRIGTRADYPPTAVTTDEVHLTRAIEIELTTSEYLPAGVPVEIGITGCRQDAGPNSNDQNR